MNLNFQQNLSRFADLVAGLCITYTVMLLYALGKIKYNTFKQSFRNVILGKWQKVLKPLLSFYPREK